MASSMPAARAWLYTQLQALTVPGQALEGVLIQNTGQWDETTSMEQMILGLPDEIVWDWATLGTRIRQETYTLPIDISTRSHGTNLPTVESRFWALVDVIEQLLKAHVDLGGTVLSTIPVGVQNPEAGPVNFAVGNTGGPVDLLARGELRIECSARI